MSKYAAGQVIEVAGYPFVRTVYHGCDADGEFQTDGWRPGVKFESGEDLCDHAAVADGLGAMLLTVVSVHKPGDFPERVFFTRQWRDPDGNVFGKTRRLLTRSAAGLTNLCRGYRHHFEVAA